MATYYINADTGNDTTGDGSSGLPWLTITKAHTEASDDDTIICQDSTAAFTLPAQVFTKTLTVEGQQDDASGAVFNGGGNARYFYLNAIKTLTVSKITFTNVAGGIVITLITGGTLNVSNCIFHNIWMNSQPTEGQIGVIAPQVNDNTMTITVTNCVFYDIFTTPAQYHYGWIAGRTTTSTTYTITGCTFYSNETAYPVSVGILIMNDITTTLTVKNCIFRDEQGASLDAIKMQYGTPTVSYCCWSGTTNEGGTGSITSDPLLVDPDNGNLHLRPASPCIDTGVLI